MTGGAPGTAGARRGEAHCVLMVCDFFFPSIGGVETHIWALGQCLLRRGHRVVVLTHSFGGARHGVRVLTNGLKVYHAPWVAAFQNCTLPTFFPLLPLLREVVVREGVEVVHGHQDSSAMVHEALFHAQTLGLRTCFTSHSLFNVFDTASLHLNKVLRFSLSGADHVICVSHTCRENMAVRCGLAGERISTIPNAVDAASFTPDPSRRDRAPRLNVVVISRLAYRKGTDLVAQVVPLVCARFPAVHFVIGGDGPKRLLLDEMCERYQLHDRVELLGSVPHTQVRDVLCRGQIFLNCSLTEAFCMAILEAASCGLFVVSTRVGGIPEVLPPDMVSFAAEPSARAVADCLSRAIEVELALGAAGGARDVWAQHARVRGMYDWKDVAERVERVYDAIRARPHNASFAQRLYRCTEAGPIAGLLSMLLVAADALLLLLVQCLRPDTDIEPAPHIDLNGIVKDGPAGLHKHEQPAATSNHQHKQGHATRHALSELNKLRRG
jgi:phosphatidylinositol glycan class A protein